MATRGSRLHTVLHVGEAERRRRRTARTGQLVPVGPGALTPKTAPVPHVPIMPRRQSDRSVLNPRQRPTRPLRPWESVTRELRTLDADDEPPPLQDGPDDPLDGGNTCSVTFTGGIVTRVKIVRLPSRAGIFDVSSVVGCISCAGLVTCAGQDHRL